MFGQILQPYKQALSTWSFKKNKNKTKKLSHFKIMIYHKNAIRFFPPNHAALPTIFKYA